MNNNNLETDSNNEYTYRATANLNTAIEEPQVNIDSMMGVNMYNSDTDVNVYSQKLDNYQVKDFNNFVSQADLQLNNVQSEFISNNNNNNSNSQFIVNEKQEFNENYNDSDLNLSNNNDKVLYKPTMKQKKKPNSGLIISKEVKMMIIIIFILLLFLFIIPYIYDFFRGLQLVITS